jgi:flavin reductase (DIM6/NTAB) family NADH-FMN oxidoreductase RutF
MKPQCPPDNYQENMHITKKDLQNAEKVFRLNVVNSVAGFKPANLIGTVNSGGNTNLAIFSSVFHLGSNPPLIGFVMRPTKIPRNTYQNIRENGWYTINHVHEGFIEKAHFTSAKFEKNVSEFDKCKLTEEFMDGFKAPFVKESKIKIGMRYLQEIPIEVNNTLLVIGEVEHMVFPDEIISPEGHLDLAAVDDVCISGLNTYYSTRNIETLPYARVEAVPDFGK